MGATGAGLGAVVLAACGQAAGEQAPAAGQAAGQITFMSRDSGTDLEPYKQGIEKFNAAQSKIKVTHEIAAGTGSTAVYFQKLTTMIVAGTPPDVSYMHSANAPSFAAEGTLLASDALAKRDKAALDGLLTGALDAYKWKGATYGIPDVATSLVMYVNKSLFAKSGTPLPTEKWTWNDYMEAAQRITNGLRSEGVYGSVDYTGNFPRFTVLWQNDADILNKDRNAVTVDAPATIEALTWIADQLHKSKVHPTPADMQGKGAQALFLEGKAAMYPTISSTMGTVARMAQFDFDLYPLPQNKKRVTRTACGGTAMLKAGKNHEAAWAFEKFLATEEFQWLIAKAGGIIFPAHKKVAESNELFSGAPFPKNPKVAVDALSYARTEPYVPLYDDLVAAYNKEIGPVWTGESSVREAVTKAKAAMEPILKDGLAKIK